MRPDSSVRRFVIGQAVAKNSDGSLCARLLQKRDDWGTADGAVAGPPPSVTGFDFLDNGDVRLHNTVRTIITKAGPPNDYFTGLSRAFPLSVIMLEWGGTDRSDVELDRIKVWLNPRKNAALNRQVVRWKLELFALADEIALTNLPKHQLTVIPIGAPVLYPPDGQPPLSSDAEGFVTFDFSTSPIVKRPQPKFSDPTRYGTFRHPTTFFVITALDKDGNGASNVGLGYDNTAPSLTAANNVLSTRSITQPFSSSFWGADNGSANGTPIITIESGTYANATIVFTTNPLNLGGAPPSDVQLRLQGNVPSGCAIIGQVRNDADSAWVTFTDGQWMTADLGLTPTQTRKFQAQLQTDSSTTVTPTLTGLGMECLAETNFIRQTKITGGSWAVDPHTMKGQIPEILLTFIRDGDRDYTDAITDFLATNHIGDVRFRLYWGDETLSRKDWLHVDDFLIDGSHPRGPSVELKCLTPLCLLRDNVPRFSAGGVFAPSSDTVVGNWTTDAGVGANLYARVNEVTFDDTTYIRSELDPINSACEIMLPTITDPNGRHQFLEYRYRTDIASGEQIDLTVQLRKGTNIIVQDVVPNIGTDSAFSATPRTIALTDAQVATIDDYTNLRVRFIANKPSGSGSRRAIVTWCRFRTSGKQEPVSYNTTLKATYDGLLASELGVDGRYRGQGVEDIQSQNQVGKTMFQTTGPTAKPVGKNELDAIAYIAGGGIISSQGKIKFVDMFTAKGAVATFPSSEIRLAEAGPGFEERMPQLFVQWKWNAAKGDFDRQEYVVHAQALLHLGKARLDPPAWVDQETAKWLSNEGLDANGLSLAGRIGVRQVQAIGPGLMLWKFTSNYRYPHLEPGDVISLQTDKFVGRDPVANRAIRGQQWVTARIQSCDVDAQNFTAWVQSYSDMLVDAGGGKTTGDRLGLGPATPHITALKAFIDESGNVTAVVTANAATAVRIVASSAGMPTDATARAAALQALDGNVQIYTGTLVSLTPGQTGYVKAFVYEKVDGSGLESLAATATMPMGIRKRAFVFDDGLYPLQATENDGTTKVSSAHNRQGSWLPTPVDSLDMHYDAGGGATGHMWVNFVWAASNGLDRTLYRPDGSTVSLLAGTLAISSTSTGSNSSTTLNDTGQSMVVNRFVGATLKITGGLGNGQNRRIIANTATQFTVESAWGTTPDATSQYTVTGAQPCPGSIPTLSQVAGGALGARTYFVRVCYVKDGLPYLPRHLTSSDWTASLAISANNLLKVTAPPVPLVGSFDGWCVVVGTGATTGILQPSTFSPPIAFGTDWTEPTSGAITSNASGTEITLTGISGGSIVLVELAASTHYFVYPYWDPVTGLIRVAYVATTPSGAKAAVQYGDGKYPMTNGSFDTQTPPVAGTTSGNAPAGGGSGGNVKILT